MYDSLHGTWWPQGASPEDSHLSFGSQSAAPRCVSSTFSLPVHLLMDMQARIVLLWARRSPSAMSTPEDPEAAAWGLQHSGGPHPWLSSSRRGVRASSLRGAEAWLYP